MDAHEDDQPEKADEEAEAHREEEVGEEERAALVMLDDPAAALGRELLRKWNGPHGKAKS